MDDEPAVTDATSTADEPSAPATDAQHQDRPVREQGAGRSDRLTPAVAVGVMALLLLCAVLVLVAWNRAPV